MARKHPYAGLPDRQFWKKEPGIADPALFDPVTDVPFKLAPDDKVVTAGSCFAQHVARFMTQSGFHHYIAEPAHPIVSDAVAKAHNYGLFSARYGNIYTARQLLQLIQRACGTFTPRVDHWPARGGQGVVDPFRPQIQPGGFLGPHELAADRTQHLAAVRDALETMDVFVFTLGLTEAWVDTTDGAVYPLAPGVAGGVWDDDAVQFHNFTLAETIADLRAALALIRDINPAVRFVLTVSPVPLNATYTDRHVFTATTYSKAVLRLAAEEVRNSTPDCAYFPSYEVITAPHVRGRYFASDCREVLEDGVRHAMSLFFRHFADHDIATPLANPAPARQPDAHLAQMEKAIAVMCDEEAIEN